MEIIDILNMCFIDSTVTKDDNFTTITWRRFGGEAHKIEIIDNGNRLALHHTYLSDCKTAFLSRKELIDLLTVLDRELTGIFDLYLISRGL